MENLPDSSETYNICIVSIDKQKIKAGITHMGQGRFQIMKHDGGEQYVGKIIDASKLFTAEFVVFAKMNGYQKKCSKREDVQTARVSLRDRQKKKGLQN